jgi:hypothetical protein
MAHIEWPWVCWPAEALDSSQEIAEQAKQAGKAAVEKAATAGSPQHPKAPPPPAPSRGSGSGGALTFHETVQQNCSSKKQPQPRKPVQSPGAGKKEGADKGMTTIKPHGPAPFLPTDE